jgi:predicted metalloprotease
MLTTRSHGSARWALGCVVVALLVGGCGSDPERGSADPTAEQDSPSNTPTTDVADPSETPFVSSCPEGEGLSVLLRCVLDEEPSVALADPGAQAPRSDVDVQNPYPYTVEEYLTYIVDDVDQMWSGWFAGQGLSEPLVGYQIVVPDQPFTSKCDLNRDGVAGDVVTHDYPNAFYCPADSIVGSDGVTYQGVVVLPVTTFQQMWTGDIFDKPSQFIGDFAAATLIAHEMGHHVQDEIWSQLAAAGNSVSNYREGDVNSENIADCFAGVWMASAYHDGVLTDTDYYEAIAALEAIGAPLGSSHGTPEQRREALLLGYNGAGAGTAAGDPANCLRAYPPQA